MPFGYTEYLEEQGKSQETIRGYLKTVHMFLGFLDNLYGKQKEVHEINPKDIKDFLNSKLNAGNEVKTVNKHLTVLKSFFDFLWQQGKAPIDPAVKIPKYKMGEEKPSIITYEMLQEILPKVINHPEYSTLRKTIYILALKGIWSIDYQFPKENVIDKGDSIEIYLNKRVLTLTGREAEIFMSHYIDAQFNSSDYVFVTKKHDKTVVPVEHMSIHTHLNAITQDFGFPEHITLNSIRHAYAYYLYTKEKRVIEEIAVILGIESKSAASLIKVSQERHIKGKELLENKMDYVVE